MEAFNLFMQCGLPVVLILIGLVVGGARERAHLRSLDRRERRLAHMLVSDVRAYALSVQTHVPAALVMGEVVIATDYLKSFISGIRKILGGELRAYQVLMLRARREALVRMLEHAQQQGYNAVCNVRLDAADIGGTTGRRGAAMAAMVATGTAYRVSDQPMR